MFSTPLQDRLLEPILQRCRECAGENRVLRVTPWKTDVAATLVPSLPNSLELLSWDFPIGLSIFFPPFCLTIKAVFPTTKKVSLKVDSPQRGGRKTEKPGDAVALFRQGVYHEEQHGPATRPVLDRALA
jgi:hypothetical protein